MKRFIFAVVWSIVFYFGACMLVGAIVGFEIGMRTPDPHAAAQKARRAAAEKVTTLRPYLLGGALLLATAGAALGFLPGTRRPREADPWASKHGMDPYAVATGYPSVPTGYPSVPEPPSPRPQRSQTVQMCTMVFLIAGIVGFQVLAPTLFPKTRGFDLSRALWAGITAAVCATLGTGIGRIIESIRK